MSIREYWLRNVGHIQVYRYHLEKPGHSLLIGALLCGLGLSPFYAVSAAVVGYLVIGKVLVRSAPSLDWIADLLIGSMAIPAVLLYLGNPVGYLLLLVWIPLYLWCVLHERWASP